jgi:hypothetical protein
MQNSSVESSSMVRSDGDPLPSAHGRMRIRPIRSGI